jgi:hypothetical protein
MRQTSGNLGNVNQLDLTMDENLLSDTRPIILHNYRLCTLISSCVFVGLLSFGLGYLTRDQYFIDCECDGSL